MPITRVCQVLALPRSSAYYHACPSDDQPLLAVIAVVAAQYPTDGACRVAKQLGRAPCRLVVNRNRARRIMRTLELLRTRRGSQRRTTNSQHHFGRFPNLVAERTAQAPDQFWVCDLTYIRLGASFIYLMIIMDVFTRDIRGWQLGRTLAQELTITALRRALGQHTPRIHHRIARPPRTETARKTVQFLGSITGLRMMQQHAFYKWMTPGSHGVPQ